MHAKPPASITSRPHRLALALTAAALLATGSLASPSFGGFLSPAHAAETSDSNDERDEVERLALHIADSFKMPLPAVQRIVAAAFSQAEAQGVSPTLILAVVAQESSFRNTARSSYGAQGLMQVSARHHPDKLRGLRHDALYRPETNIRVGTQVLAEYLEQHNGRLDQALKKYSGNASSYPRKIRAFWTRLEHVRRTASVDALQPLGSV